MPAGAVITLAGMLRRVALLAAAVAVCALPGCAAAPAPSPTPAPSFTSDEQAFAAAEATYRAYVDALNHVDLADPATFEPVYALTTGELNVSDRKNFSKWHSDQLTIVGDASVLSVSLSKNGTDRILACYDVTAVDVLDADGASIVSANRPNIQALLITMSSAPSTVTGLRIDRIEPAEDLQC
jgi:hypothetical protein